MATTITPRIVTVNTSVTLAPSVSQLQKSGAIISLGGTTLTTNDYQYCGNLAAVSAILGSSGNNAELLAMATTFFAQGNAIGLYVLELGTEASPGDNIAALQTWITANSSPQVFYAYLTPAAWDGIEGVNSVIITNGGSGYAAAPTVTFSAPTSGTTATGTAVLTGDTVTSVIITDPGIGYTAAPTVTFSAPTTGTTATGTATVGSALDGVASNYTAPSGKTYFFVTTTSSNIGLYAAHKSVWTHVDAPTAASTEFGCAADFYDFLSTNPSISAPAAPLAYRYQFGVTPWARGSTNNAEIDTILTAYGNVSLTLSEGGLSNVGLYKGTLMDGNEAMFWYAVDWFQIQAKEQIANAIINGSNNSAAPLYYNQSGINTLESLVQSIANTSISYGLNLSATVSATPFYTYTQANPSDYAAGIYDGLACTITPQLGFLTITFNLDATNFVAGA